jgi:hypothetical protein
MPKKLKNLVEGATINAYENGCLLEGEVARIYDDSVELTGVTMWNKKGTDFSYRGECEVRFEQICQN